MTSSSSSSSETVREKIFKALKQQPTRQQNIKIKIQNNQFWIIFNRPKRMNSFSMDMYIYFTELIKKANDLPLIKYIIITGNGNHFSAGNDLNNFTHPMILQLDQFQRPLMIKYMSQMLRQLCQSIINSEKPIFALLQGNVVGFSFTQLALYDKIFADQNCNFFAPLVKIAQGPEMCSSYMFPKIFGKKLAQEIVIQGRSITTSTLQKHQFLQKFENIQQAKKGLQQHLLYLDELQWQSYLAARKLFRDPQRDILMKVNKKECENLVERWLNPKLVGFLIQYLQKQKDKKKKN